MEQAEDYILSFLINLGVVPNQLIIAGNSVHVDKLFLFHQMPKLNAFLHYRIVDVSSIKILVNSVNPQLFYKKNNSHRAMDDIL